MYLLPPLVSFCDMSETAVSLFAAEIYDSHHQAHSKFKFLNQWRRFWQYIFYIENTEHILLKYIIFVFVVLSFTYESVVGNMLSTVPATGKTKHTTYISGFQVVWVVNESRITWG